MPSFAPISTSLKVRREVKHAVSLLCGQMSRNDLGSICGAVCRQIGHVQAGNRLQHDCLLPGGKRISDVICFIGVSLFMDYQTNSAPYGFRHGVMGDPFDREHADSGTLAGLEYAQAYSFGAALNVVS